LWAIRSGWAFNWNCACIAWEETLWGHFMPWSPMV
jgi:hypothetical protein